MTADRPRLSEQDRGAALDQLKNAYMDGAFDHEELDRRMDVVLTATDGSEFEGVVGDLRNAPAVIPRDNSWRVAGSILAASAVGVVLYVAVVMGPSSPPSLEGVCFSTGMSSVELDCPDATAEQTEIEQRAEIARSAADQASELASGQSPDSEVQQAAEAAEAAAGEARQAVRDGQAIMADALFEEPAVGAFDDAVAKARSAARDAVQGLNDVEVALEG